MAPAYAYQDSFPSQTGRGQYVPYLQPAPEAAPSKTMVGPSSVPMFYGPGPYGADYSYPYHSCCNHVPFHGHYGYSPSYPHFVPPQPSPWWGSYAVCPPFVPVHHVPPAPPVHAAGIPQYEYDKDAARPGNLRCCGCPNHVCSPGKGEQSIRVEEEEPSLEEEKPSFGGAMQPVNSRNFRYPIVWIPPEYVKNDEGRRPLESMSGGTSQDVISQRRSSQQEPSWRSVFPIQLEDLGLQKPDEGGWRKGNQQLGDKRNQFSYPIIWMPHAKQEEVETYVSPKCSHQGLPSDSSPKSPRNLTANDKIGASGVEGETGINTTSKHAGEKNIPVKDAESSAVNVHQEDAWKRATDVSREGVEDKGKASSGRKEPVSPKEKPKLPPVCLRVDPLPRGKKSTGNSRSPSPPGARENASSGEEKRKQVKVIEVKDCPTGKKDEEMVMERQLEHPIMSNSHGRDELNNREASQENVASDGKTEENKGTVAKPLPDTEAATLIQAAYRGFEVRKWETKRKLKQMARIRNEVAKIKKRIQELESSHNASFDQEKFAKQRMVIGESIMSLLLTLDTIQGLHPSLRDVRKSLARELVTLQEKLDLLVTRTSGEHIEKSEEYMHEDPAEDANKQPQKSEKECSQHSEAISEHNESMPTDNVVESPEVQPFNAEVSLSSPLEVESSGEVVDADHGGQVLASSDMSCREEAVKSDRSIEQVSELKKSWEDEDCENTKEESDEVSGDGTVKTDAMGGPTESMDHEDPVSRDQEQGTKLRVELPAGVLAGVDQEITGLQEKMDGPEHHLQQETLKEETEGSKTVTNTESKPVARPEMEENEELVGSPLDEKESLWKEEDDGGDASPAALYEEGAFAFPSEEINKMEALAQTDQVFGKQIDSNTGEGSAKEKEMEEKQGQGQGQGDAHGPERIDVQQVVENPHVAEVPDEQVEVSVDDQPVSEGAEVLGDESKSGDSILGNEIERKEKLLAENEKLREMMQKLMEAGKEQLDVISSLTERVKDLEKKLAKNRKKRSRRSKFSAAARPSSVKRSADSTERASADAAM